LSPEPVIQATAFPIGQIGQPYAAEFNLTGGTPPFTWKLGGSLPTGLTFDGKGRIEGTPTETGIFFVDVWATDSSSPPQSAHGYGNIQIHFAPPTKRGRNDTIATATPLGYATGASISPFDDPSSEGPDQDYYKLFATTGSTVDILVTPQDPLDSVLEIVDANGIRYKTCNDPADDNPDPATGIAKDPTPNGFDDECMNDDVESGS
jgi:hypothetical protein